VTCDHRDRALDIGPGSPSSPISDDGAIALPTVLTGQDDTTIVSRT
jgi:hypothetical protein